MPKRTPFGKEAISNTTHKPATNTMYMNANPTAATALWRVITTTYSSPVVSGTIYVVGTYRPLHRKVIGAKGSLTSRLYKKTFSVTQTPLVATNPSVTTCHLPYILHSKTQRRRLILSDISCLSFFPAVYRSITGCCVSHVEKVARSDRRVEKHHLINSFISDI